MYMNTRNSEILSCLIRTTLPGDALRAVSSRDLDMFGNASTLVDEAYRGKGYAKLNRRDMVSRAIPYGNYN